MVAQTITTTGSQLAAVGLVSAPTTRQVSSSTA
jgi:hypothetical protein